jgi:hypothetical protein
MDNRKDISLVTIAINIKKETYESEKTSMKILDKDSGKLLDSVVLMLTPTEAKQLVDFMKNIKPEQGDHIHVDNDNFQTGITVLVYTEDNLNFFSKDVRDIILGNKD